MCKSKFYLPFSRDHFNKTILFSHITASFLRIVGNYLPVLKGIKPSEPQKYAGEDDNNVFDKWRRSIFGKTDFVALISMRKESLSNAGESLEERFGRVFGSIVHSLQASFSLHHGVHKCSED
jgi:hypothetical protein